MNKDKIKYLKDKKVEKTADANYQAVNNSMQNPIKSKFIAFKKTKKELDLKDLF